MKVGRSCRETPFTNKRITKRLPIFGLAFTFVSKRGQVQVFYMKINFISMPMSVHLRVNKTNFNMKRFAQGLAMKQIRTFEPKVAYHLRLLLLLVLLFLDVRRLLLILLQLFRMRIMTLPRRQRKGRSFLL